MATYRVGCAVTDTHAPTTVRSVEIVGYTGNFAGRLGVLVRVYAEATWVFDILPDYDSDCWWFGPDCYPYLQSMEVDGLTFDLTEGGDCNSEKLLLGSEIREAAELIGRQFIVAIRAARLRDTFYEYAQSLMPAP